MDVDSIVRSPLTCLDLPPGDAIFVGPCLRLHFQADTCFYFVGGQLFDSHQLDDHPARNLAIARCALHGLATAKSLAAVHGVSPRTVSRAVKRLRRTARRFNVNFQTLRN